MESLLGFKLDFWDYATFGVLFLLVLAGLISVVWLAGLPGRIAIARKHPDAEAVKMMGYAGFLAAVPWILHGVTTTGGSPYVRQLLQVNPYYPEFGPLSATGFLQRLGENARIYLLGMAPVAVMPALYGSTYSPPEMQRLFYPLWIAVPLLVPMAAGLWRGLCGRGLMPGLSGRGLVPGLSGRGLVSGSRGRGLVRVRSGVGPPRETVGVLASEFRADPVACVVLASLLLLCLWPTIWAGSRFLVPITSPLLLVWWSGWRLPQEIGLRGRWDRVRTVLLVLLLLLGVRNLVFYTQETRAYPPEWENYFSSLAWIRENTPRDAVIIDRKPGLAEFSAGRKAQGFPRETDPSRMIESFKRSGATHVVLATLPYDDIERYLRPAIEKRRSFFRLVHRTPEPITYVLEFLPDGGGDATPPEVR